MTILASPKVIQHRWQTCRKCDFLSKTGVCQKCGCFIGTKIPIANTVCKAEKWETHDPKGIGIQGQKQR